MEYKNWDFARMILSENFTVSIGDRREEVETLARNIDNLEAYGYKFATWDDFVNVELPDGLLDRANEWRDGDSNFVFVVYDPLDDKSGYLLFSNNAITLSQEVCDYISSSEPSEGPLSPDNLIMKELESA